MASSIASHVNLGNGSSLEELEIHLPKLTAIDKTGGIYCHICNTIFGNKKDYDSHYYTQHKIEGAEIVYTCVVCKKQISSYPKFRGHCYLNHVVKNKFQCKHCSKSFCKLCILNSHISAVHDYKCISCDKKFTTKKDLENHKITHGKTIKAGKGVPPYDCLSCGKVIKTVDVCESHIDDHCEIQYPCPICKEVKPNKLEATKHLMIHFDENIPTDISPTKPSISEDSSIDILGGILCCHCDSLFRNRTEIDSHFTAEHEDKVIVYTCNICGKQYEKYGVFGSHCHDHISRDKFQCDQCNKTFPRLSLLVIHTEGFHTGCTTDKPFSCEQCSHGFMTRNRLQEHMRIVHEESNIRCMKPGCSATFEKPKSLIQHLKNHNAFLDNWCRQCGLQFASLSSAEKHLDVHRSKQYSCPVCKREYREKYLMVKHIPSHFESLLHVCKMCCKAFLARNRLMEHLKTHSDLRSFRCTYCNKGFRKPHELEQHLNVHTGRKPYSCTICPKTFASYPNWSKHLTRMHDFDKATIKRLNAARGTSKEPKAVNASPTKPESGIESAGSELSVDFYTFMESDDSNEVRDRQRYWETRNHEDQIANIDMQEMNTICDPVSGEFMSITDTVNAVIDRIDSLGDDLDLIAGNVEMNGFDMAKSDFHTENILSREVDDASDIKAIVEHIDAMSGDMEAVNLVHSITNSVSGMENNSDVLQYADMMPVDNAIFNNIPDSTHASLPEVSYYQPSACLPEYGPDFITQGAGLACDSFTNLDDCLPHINPLLTFKPEENAKMYVQNINNFNFDNVNAPIGYDTQNEWEPPILTKVFQYEESNDANRMYIY